MSLENRIEELTRAIIALTAVVQSQQATSPAPIVPATQGTRTKKEKVEPVVEVTEVLTEIVTVEIPTLKEAKPADVTPKSTTTLNVEAATVRTYAEVAVHLGKLMSLKGRNALVDLLAEFDAPNGKALKPEQYPAVWDRASELMGE